MKRVWEEGDAILRRSIEPGEFQGRDYVRKAIARGRTPFLDLRIIGQSDGSGTILHNATECENLAVALTGDSRGTILLPRYLKMMELVLAAVGRAEEQMILSSTFVIDGNTVFYHRKSDSVRFAYAPCPKEEKTSGRILLTLWEWTGEIDPEFGIKWPFLGEMFTELMRESAGRFSCMEAIRQLQREFPRERTMRGRFGMEDND